MNCCFEYCDLDTRRILKYFLNIDLNTGLVILNIDSLTFSMCEHSASILAWEHILMHHCVSIVWSVLTFLPGGLVHHCWREILKYNLFFAFEYSFQNEKCNCLFSFTNLLSVFFLVYEVRRYNGELYSCAYVSHPMKFTLFIDESVGKNHFPAYTGVTSSYIKL